MSTWNYSQIEAKIRATTGRVDESMLSSATILDYANKFYQYVLPKELKIFWGYTYFSFFTEAGQSKYKGPVEEFQTLNPRVSADGFLMDWYLSPDTFFSDFQDKYNKQSVATGDGTNNSFSFPVSAYPILPGSLYVTDGTQTAQDNGSGGFIAPASGSIDYLTGSVTNLAFLSIPAANTTITASYQTYQANRPRAILYYEQKPLSNAIQTTRDDNKVFELRPVPDTVYKITMEGIQVPAPFSLDNFIIENEITIYTDVPFRADLGPLIAYGASLEIFADLNQMDQYQEILVQYNRYKDVSMQDTYEEYMYERSVPRF